MYFQKTLNNYFSELTSILRLNKHESILLLAKLVKEWYDILSEFLPTLSEGLKKHTKHGHYNKTMSENVKNVSKLRSNMCLSTKDSQENY